jgi:hypothetical protein
MAPVYSRIKNAFNLVSLLGLVAIYEHKNPEAYAEYWWKADMPRACWCFQPPRLSTFQCGTGHKGV